MNEPDPEDTDWRGRAEAAEHALAVAVAEAQQRVVRAELKAEALKAGMVDLDGIKLLDEGSVVLDDAGAVANAPVVMAALKRAKPWLFGGHSSSSGAKPPAAQPPTRRQATEMAHDEWRAARAELLRRR